MATVFTSHGRVRIAVNTRDHPPPHVHAFGAGREARFKLNCPQRPVELWNFVGGWTMAELNGLGLEIAVRIDDCCEARRHAHG